MSNKLRRSFSTGILNDDSFDYISSAEQIINEENDKLYNNNNFNNNNLNNGKNKEKKANTSPRSEFVKFAYDVYDKIKYMNDNEEVLSFNDANKWAEDRAKRLIYKEWTLTPKGSPYTWILTADEAIQVAVMILSTDFLNREQFLLNLVMWKKQPWEDALNDHINELLEKVCDYLFTSDILVRNELKSDVIDNIKTVKRLPNLLNEINIQELCDEANKIVLQNGDFNINNLSVKWKKTLKERLMLNMKEQINKFVDDLIDDNSNKLLSFKSFYHWPIIDNLDIHRLEKDAQTLISGDEVLISQFLLINRETNDNDELSMLWYDAFQRILYNFMNDVCAYLLSSEPFDPEKVFVELKASKLAECVPILWNKIGEIIPSEIVGDGGFMLICHAQTLISDRKKAKISIEKYIANELSQHVARQFEWRKTLCHCASEWIELTQQNTFITRNISLINNDVAENMWKQRHLLFIYTHRSSGYSFIGRVGPNSTLSRRLSHHILCAFGLINSQEWLFLYPMIRLSKPEDWQLTILRSVIPARTSLANLQCYWIGELQTAYPRGLNRSLDDIIPARDPARFDLLCCVYIDVIQNSSNLLYKYEETLSKKEDNEMLQNRTIAYLVSNLRGLASAIKQYEKLKL